MKYVISFYCILFCLNLRADPIHIYYENDSYFADEIKLILTDQYNIPEEIITLKKTPLCKDVIKKSKLDVCINKNGDLNVVSVDDRFISESLKVFKAPKGHQ
jgi:hypothetical protein